MLQKQEKKITNWLDKMYIFLNYLLWFSNIKKFNENTFQK